MLVSIAFFVLLLAIAFRQASFGFFSALIMAVLTICCAAGAVGLQESLATKVFAEYWQPNYAYALGLALPFGVGLLILRVLFDKLIRRACLLPSLVDRIGGGVCGLVTAFLIVGVMAASIQMIPFGGSILGFQRVPIAQADAGAAPAKPIVEGEENDLWLSPDRFLAGLGYYTSAGIFSGENNFFHDYPDWVQANGWVNAIPEGMSSYAKPGSISVQGTRKLSQVYRMVPGSEREGRAAVYEPIEPKGGREFRMIRVKLQDGAKDQNKSHVFTPRQFRLVGRAGDRLQQNHGVAVPQETGSAMTKHVRIRNEGAADLPAADLVHAAGEDDTVEVVFDLPTGFEPIFIEYKHAARAKVSFKDSAESASNPADAGEKKERASAAPTPPGSAAAPPGEAPGGSRRSSEPRREGNIRTLTTQSSKSFFGDQLPMELKAYRKKGADIDRGKLTSGHLAGEVEKQAAGTDDPVTKFDVPDDKRLLHLNVGALQTRSGLGRAISFAVTAIQNYFVEDANGNRYELAGKYAIAKAGDATAIEVMYFKERAGSVGQIGQFEKIKERDLQGDYQLVLLFLIEPGAQITAFSTGGDATRRDDLSMDNLVAPR